MNKLFLILGSLMLMPGEDVTAQTKPRIQVQFHLLEYEYTRQYSTELGKTALDKLQNAFSGRLATFLSEKIPVFTFTAEEQPDKLTVEFGTVARIVNAHNVAMTFRISGKNVTESTSVTWPRFLEQQRFWDLRPDFLKYAMVPFEEAYQSETCRNALISLLQCRRITECKAEINVKGQTWNLSYTQEEFNAGTGTAFLICNNHVNKTERSYVGMVTARCEPRLHVIVEGTDKHSFENLIHFSITTLTEKEKFSYMQLLSFNPSRHGFADNKPLEPTKSPYAQESNRKR